MSKSFLDDLHENNLYSKTYELNYDSEVVDKVMTVTNEDAVKIAKELANKEGIFCGISSGAALSAALELSNKEENKGKLIVVILPDTGMRYLSSVMFQD